MRHDDDLIEDPCDQALGDAEEDQALDAIADDLARQDALTQLHQEPDDDQPTYGGGQFLAPHEAQEAVMRAERAPHAGIHRGYTPCDTNGERARCLKNFRTGLGDGR